MNNIVFDFRLNYTRGDRLPAMEVVYQYDTGRTIEACVPKNEEEFVLHVGFEEDATLTVVNVDDVEEDTEEGGYMVTATMPDEILERSGNLLVYVVAVDTGVTVTTYEGSVEVRRKAPAEEGE